MSSSSSNEIPISYDLKIHKINKWLNVPIVFLRMDEINTLYLYRCSNNVGVRTHIETWSYYNKVITYASVVFFLFFTVFFLRSSVAFHNLHPSLFWADMSVNIDTNVGLVFFTRGPWPEKGHVIGLITFVVKNGNKIFPLSHSVINIRGKLSRKRKFCMRKVSVIMKKNFLT